jgi:hypothetical protein
MEGYHVIRRSNQFWSGIGCDLAIEQTLMRSLKTSGGLTHGSKMTEGQRVLWTASAPAMSEYNAAMQDFNDVAYTTSEQHKECTTARMDRDASELLKIRTKLSLCSPFSNDATLRNIVNGIVCNDKVNVHEFQSIGEGIIKKMNGGNIFSYSFKRSDQVRTMVSSSAVPVSPDRSINTILLFQRFLVASRSAEVSAEEVMSYELSAFPISLFQDKSLIRKADKHHLAQAIDSHYCKQTTNVDHVIPQNTKYVLDGGSLLHRLKWNKGVTYGEISKSYATFTLKHYGKAVIAYDDYEEGPTIKDNTHLRRLRNRNSPAVSIKSKTKFAGKQEDVLSSGKNKHQIIQLVRHELINAGCTVLQAGSDADVDIAVTAVNMVTEQAIIVIGEDTDLY